MVGTPSVRVTRVEGDLLDQRVDALVNPWNRNFVPPWLLLTGGVSAQLKKVTGREPWHELRRAGVLPVGAAVVTSAGNLPTTRLLVHAAGLNAWWRASAAGVELCTTNAVRAAANAGARSLATPLIGAGHGGLSATAAEDAINAALERFPHSRTPDLDVVVVSPA